jgi:hypothetical protein
VLGTMEANRIIVNTEHVHDVGQTIINDATRFINSDTKDFQSMLNEVKERDEHYSYFCLSRSQ